MSFSAHHDYPRNARSRTVWTRPPDRYWTPHWSYDALDTVPTDFFSRERERSYASLLLPFLHYILVVGV
jgi:hypothetical protein